MVLQLPRIRRRLADRQQELRRCLPFGSAVRTVRRGANRNQHNQHGGGAHGGESWIHLAAVRALSVGPTEERRSELGREIYYPASCVVRALTYPIRLYLIAIFN